MGGVPIFIGCVFTLIAWLPYDIALELKYLFTSLSIMFIIGLRDDLIPLRPTTKILSQLIPILFFVYLTGIQINSFYEINGSQIPNSISFIITAFFLLSFSNSLNLIDGIDGLAGSISILILVFFGVWFVYTDEPYLSALIFCLLGAISAFLIFNWNPSKIFMGDTGALFIGFFIAYLTIEFLNINQSISEGHSFKFSSPISTAISVLIIPTVDTLRVVVVRIMKKESPLKADKNHLHHILIGGGFTHGQATLILVLINVLFILLAIASGKIPPIWAWTLLLTGISLALSSIFLISRFRKTRNRPSTT